MHNKRKIMLTGITVGMWVAVFIYVQSAIYQALRIPAERLEVWPVLMAPALVALLGGGKNAKKRFYVTSATGIVSACVFVLLEHAILPMMGKPGVLLALGLIICVLIVLTKNCPQVAGPISFVYLNAATILTDDIISLTVLRLFMSLIGAAIFLSVEHFLIALVNKERGEDDKA